MPAPRRSTALRSNTGTRSGPNAARSDAEWGTVPTNDIYLSIADGPRAGHVSLGWVSVLAHSHNEPFGDLQCPIYDETHAREDRQRLQGDVRRCHDYRPRGHEQ